MSDRFRNRMIAALESTGMTVAELSRRSGVSYDAISKLKRRENASTSMENAEKIAKALGIKPETAGFSEGDDTFDTQTQPQSETVDPRGTHAELGHNDIGVSIRDGKIIVNAAVDKEGLESLRKMLDAMERLIDQQK